MVQSAEEMRREINALSLVTKSLEDVIEIYINNETYIDVRNKFELPRMCDLHTINVSRINHLRTELIKLGGES